MDEAGLNNTFIKSAKVSNLMKLLLTSAGFENAKIGRKFVELVGKPASEIRVVFIPTASRTKEESRYADEARKEILNTGVRGENIKTLNLDHHISYPEIKDFDAIYVCGGNTFFLLHQARKTGFDKIIKQFLNDGKLYVGVSAGSILVCPTTELAVPYDKNDLGISDFTGLNLVDVVIAPHYSDKGKDKEIIKKYGKRLAYEIIALTDQQAYLVLGQNAEIIQ
ncbi:MAG TPA: Type 1 glutamine amidotransferase-like domain-containing protein [Candidatus Nanoarchaeia archaeon]|nr:Type 1 glutamine amidotransferase-like domain-containing protein [Candidatus Nanoarchaeia archaeon]